MVTRTVLQYHAGLQYLRCSVLWNICCPCKFYAKLYASVPVPERKEKPKGGNDDENNGPSDNDGMDFGDKELDVKNKVNPVPGETTSTLSSPMTQCVVRSAASSYAAMRMVAGSRPGLVIAWKWHVRLALLCGCSGALEYATNSCGSINKSLSLSIGLKILVQGMLMAHG